MTRHVGEQPRTPPRRRPKRRRRWALSAIAATALWLLGHGLGWFGSAPTTAPGSAGPGASTAHAAGLGGAPDPAGALSGSAATDAQAAPGAIEDAPRRGATATEPAREPARIQPATLDPDQFASLLSRVELHLDQAALGRAAAVLARLETQVARHADASAQVAGRRERLERAMGAAEARVVELVAAGDVLGADALAATLAAEGQWRPAYAVKDAVSLGADWMRTPKLSAIRKASSLRRQRRVRLDWAGQLREGTVARCSDAAVTVHLALEGGQRFPTVPMVEVEPLLASGEESVEMALAAAHAGAPRLARLWLLRASMQGEGLGARGESLRAAVSIE